MRHARSTLVAAFTGIALGATTIPALAAAPPSPLTAAKSAATKQADARLLYSGIESYLTLKDKHVPAADRKILLKSIADDVTILKAERKAISAAGTVALVKADLKKIIALRTFEFVLPRVNVVRDSDNLAAYSVAFTAKEAKYEASITKAAAAKKDVVAAQAALVDFKTQVTLSTALAASSHSAISLVRGATGAEKALALDAAKNLGATLHLIVAIHDAITIAHVTGGKV